MQISAEMVKELRERTGAGMMDCKKALTEAQGDLDAAIDLMRKSGLAKAVKKAGRVALQGMVAVVIESDQAAIVEVNCETDFVAKSDAFIAFATGVAASAVSHGADSVEQLARLPFAGDPAGSIEDARLALFSKIGENIVIRRLTTKCAGGGCLFAHYLHRNQGLQMIGVLVELEGGDAALAREIAMHISWARPGYLNKDSVPEEFLDREREIHRAEAAKRGIGEKVLDKFIEGRLGKHLQEIVLLEQPFVRDQGKAIGTLLREKGAHVRSYLRYEVGESISAEKI